MAGLLLSFLLLTAQSVFDSPVGVALSPLEASSDRDDWLPEFLARLHPDSEASQIVTTLGSTATSQELIVALGQYFRSRNSEIRLWAIPKPESIDPSYQDDRSEKAIDHFIIAREGGEQFGELLPWFDDTKKIITLSRFPHLNYLAHSYFHTGDEKYAAAMVRDMMDFVEHVPLSAAEGYHVQMNLNSNPWNWVLLQWRVKRWIDSLEYLRDSPSLSDEQYLQIVLHIWKEIDWLIPRKVLGLHNGTLGNLSAILYASQYFPEAARSSAWEQDAVGFFGAFIDTAFYPREFLVELTIGYSEGTLLMCLDMFESLPASPVKEEIKPKLEAIVDAHIGVMKPDRSLPRYGDHAIYDIRERLLRRGARLFQRPDLDLIADDESVSTLPNGRLSFPFESDPYYLSGYYAMRDGWDVNANYLSMDAGPYGTNHHHGDKLSIAVSGDGAEFIVDPGTSLYRSIEPGPRIDLRPGYLHNNITIDGIDVNSGWDRHYAFDVLENRWVTNATYDFLEGTYEYRVNLLDVIWRRSVLFRKGEYWVVVDALLGLPDSSSTGTVKSSAIHRIESNFQTMIGTDVRAGPDRVLLKSDNGATLSIDSAPEDGLAPVVVIGDTTQRATTFLLQYPSYVDWTIGGRGWVGMFGNESDRDATQTYPAPAVVYEGAQTVPHTSVRVLSPSQNKVAISRKVEWVERSDDHFRIQITTENSEVVDVLDWTIAQRADGRTKLGADVGYWYRIDSGSVSEVVMLNASRVVIRSGSESLLIEFDSPFEGVIKRVESGWSLFVDEYLPKPVVLTTFTRSAGRLAAPDRYSVDGGGEGVPLEPGETYDLRSGR